MRVDSQIKRDQYPDTEVVYQSGRCFRKRSLLHGDETHHHQDSHFTPTITITAESDQQRVHSDVHIRQPRRSDERPKISHLLRFQSSRLHQGRHRLPEIIVLADPHCHS